MRMEILFSEKTKRVSPQDIADYATFSKRLRLSSDTSEIQIFERFYAARSLSSQGMDTLLDALLLDPEDGSTTEIDVCGLKGDEITVVFCETDRPRTLLGKSVKKINSAKNASGIILVPSISDLRQIEQALPSIPEGRRMTIETLGWLDEQFDMTLRQTLWLIDVLGNETRMRMLAPLLKRAGAKRDYRTRINPKLVYQNLSLLQEAGLVDESTEGLYELSDLGRSLLAEFITFLEKTRRTLDSTLRQREVKMV